MLTERMLTAVQFEILLDTDSQSVTTSSNKTVLRFFTCRFGCLMQVGLSFFHLSLPLSVCLSLWLSSFYCVPLGIHTELSVSHTQTLTHTRIPFLGAASDFGMKSISEAASSHHSVWAPVFSHHEVRVVPCQPENEHTAPPSTSYSHPGIL